MDLNTLNSESKLPMLRSSEARSALARVRTGARSIVGMALSTMLLLLSAPSLGIAPTTPAESANAQANALVRAFAAKSDSELTTLSANWQNLNRLERRVLLREVKLRMARQKGRQGVLRIRTERRFGRVVRQSDGRVVRLETRVVQIRKSPSGQVSEVAAGPAAGKETQQAPSGNQGRPARGAVQAASARVNAPVVLRRQYGTGFDQRQKAPASEPTLAPTDP